MQKSVKAKVFFCKNWSISVFWVMHREKPFAALLFKKKKFFKQPYWSKVTESNTRINDHDPPYKNATGFGRYTTFD